MSACATCTVCSSEGSRSLAKCILSVCISSCIPSLCDPHCKEWASTALHQALCDSTGVRLSAYMSRLATLRGAGCCSPCHMIACPASCRIALDAIALLQKALCTVQHPSLACVDIACFLCLGRFTAQRKSRAGRRNHRWQMGCQGRRPDNSHMGPATRALLQGPDRPPQAP